MSTESPSLIITPTAYRIYSLSRSFRLNTADADLVYQILRPTAHGYPPTLIPFPSMDKFLQSFNPTYKRLQAGRIAILQTLSKIFSIHG